MTTSALILTIAVTLTVASSNALTLYICLTWTRDRNASAGPLLADCLDRLQESIGTIHQYQVAINADRLQTLTPAAPAGDAARVAPSTDVSLPDDVYHPDGTIDQDKLAAWIAEEQPEEYEIPLVME